MKKRKGSAHPVVIWPILLICLIINLIACLCITASATEVPGSEIAPPGGSSTLTPIDPPKEEEEEETVPEEPEEIEEPEKTEEPEVEEETKEEPPAPPPADTKPEGEEQKEPTPPKEPEPEKPTQPDSTGGGSASGGDEGPPRDETTTSGGTESEDTEATEEPTTTVPKPVRDVNVKDPVGEYPENLNTSSITVKSPVLDVLLVEGANLETLLYPSKIVLPTKYMDVLMAAPFEDIEVKGEVAYFLNTIAPHANGTFTYAEYRAAELYLTVCRIYKEDQHETAAGAALRRVDDEASANWMRNITDAYLTRGAEFQKLIREYRPLLEHYASGGKLQDHEQYEAFKQGVGDTLITVGEISDLARTFSGDRTYDQYYTRYFDSLYSWWERIGVIHMFTAAVMEYSYYYDEFSYNGVNFTRGAPSDFVVDAPTTEEDTSGEEGNSGQNTGWVDNPNNGVSDSPVSSVGDGSAGNTSPVTEKSYGWKDAISIIAFAFVIVAVVVLWVLKSMRKKNDPANRKWE